MLAPKSDGLGAHTLKKTSCQMEINARMCVHIFVNLEIRLLNWLCREFCGYLLVCRV